MGVTVVAQQVMNLTSIHKDVSSTPGLSGLKTRYCHELWYRLKTWLGSCVSVAVV